MQVVGRALGIAHVELRRLTDVDEIADDGGGLDYARIRAKAVQSGLLAPDAVTDYGSDGICERLRTGGGPFVVIAHSQGSLIAYDVLSSPEFAGLDIRLFVTIGSPLGIQEVQDQLLVHTGQTGGLRVPACVGRWINVADPLDPVAFDKRLVGDFAANARGTRVEDDLEWNGDSPRPGEPGRGSRHRSQRSRV